MQSKNFQLKGIVEPGRVDVRLNNRFRQVNLVDLCDEDLKQLYDNGCPFLQLTLEGRKLYFPNEKTIQVTEINLPQTVAKKRNTK